MFRIQYVALTLLLVSVFAGTAPTAFAADFEANSDAQSLGAFTYRVEANPKLSRVEVLAAGGSRIATIGVSFDADSGTLLDLRIDHGAHLSVLWNGPEGGLLVTDRETGEIAVLQGEWGKSNQGEGIALIDRHRDALAMLGAVYGDLDLQVFGGDATAGKGADRESGHAGGGLGLDSKVEGIFDPDPQCFGPEQLGFGTSFTASVPVAAAEAVQDANNKCTNQFCWGCCEFTRPTICQTILFVTTCTAYGRKCGTPCV